MNIIAAISFIIAVCLAGVVIDLLVKNRELKRQNDELNYLDDKRLCETKTQDWYGI